MTDTPRTPPPTAATHHERPFTGHPGRWEKERARALRTGHGRDRTCSTACEPVLVHERTRWGWLAWTVPGDGSPPEIPHQIGVLTPAATRAQRLAVRWLTRRPAPHITLAIARGSLRLSTACVALIGLLTGLFAARHGIPVDVALPAMLLAPLLAEHVPDRLDARAGECVRSVEDANACRYLQRLAALQSSLVQAAAGSDRYEVRRAAEVGQQVLWEAADLLQNGETGLGSFELIACKRLMLQLTCQVAQMLTHTTDGSTRGAPASDLASSQPPATSPTPRPVSRHTPIPPPQQGTLPVSQHELRQPALALDVYLLFAHEPYYVAGAQEINTTVVAAATLLHPRVRQPDGARMHARLVHGRRPGEIVPLSTLTHELDGGARWPEVGDWEAVTGDLVHLLRDHECDALSLGLPEIARALVCAGPRSEICAVDPMSGAHRVYPPADRVEVLVQVGRQLAWAEAGSPLWPGDGLLSPLVRPV